MFCVLKFPTGWQSEHPVVSESGSVFGKDVEKEV
jgi:hypothetical protein